MKELIQEVISLYNDINTVYRHIHVNYGDELEKSIVGIQKHLKKPENFEITDRISSRYIAIKLLEKDDNINSFIVKSPHFSKISKSAEEEAFRIKSIYDEDSQVVITDAKYGFISGALKETYIKGNDKKRENTEIIDAFVTHKLFGFPIFFAFLWLMFTATFVLGEYPMNWIEKGVAALSWLVQNTMPDGSFKDLIVDGVIGGVGGVIVFLPNILLLFLFISFLEDSGYMARAVFIMDRIMHKIGLHGKSFISLVMGFGCNVPAIMSTRTIEDKKNRMLTILINPFMSCSARLPVYLLIIGAIFPTHRGTILFSVYLGGILMAVIMALVFKNTLFRGEDTPFVMELPPYRMPTMRSVTRHMWTKGSQYLKKMGGVILLASILLWALGYFPRTTNYSANLLAAKSNLEKEMNVYSGDSVQQNNTVLKLKDVTRQLETERLEKSYIGRIGKFIEPAIRPLGFDWKMGISLFSGIAAKEVVVSTFGVLYQAGDDNSEQKLIERIRNDKYDSGPNKDEKVFSIAASMAFIVFTLLYFPCIAVIASVRRESGNIWWAFFMMFYTTALAWFMSFVVYNGINFFK
jgi:ferrous iron transport protein B